MMSSKGVKHWESIWDKGSTAFENENKSKKIENSEEARQNHQNHKTLYIINEMLREYSTLYFTTHGKMIENRYFGTGMTHGMNPGFIKSNCRFDGLKHIGDEKDLYKGFTLLNASDTGNALHVFYCYCDEEQKKTIDNKIESEIKKRLSDQTIPHIHHPIKVDKLTSDNYLILASNDYRKIINQKYHDPLTAMKLLARLFYTAEKSIVQDGDVHQILQVISSKTNLSIDEMGFTIQPKNPSFLSSIFPAAQTQEKEKGDKKPHSPTQ